MHRTALLFLLIGTLTWGCSNPPTITGLWTVKSVSAGDNIMTPNGRWMRFNSDYTQASGNGWFQHSIGTYEFDKTTNKLSVVNTNGQTDPFEPFSVRFDDDEMIWNRSEEGQSIEVRLVRIEDLPTIASDQLLGLWELETVTGNGNQLLSTMNLEQGKKTSLNFRWDKRFEIRNGDMRIDGIYNVHGHKDEVELIPYNSDLERSFCTIQLDDTNLNMQLLNTEEAVTRSFKRIHRLP